MTDAQAPAGCGVLVTGGEGFVGRWLLPTLRADAGFGRVVAARRHPAADDPDALTLDVRDRAAVHAAVRALRPRTIIHLAAVSAVPAARADTGLAWAVNLDGTRHLAEATLQEAPAARFVFVGTSEAYGGTFKARGVPLDEAALLDPANTYAATKAAADLLIGQMARDGLNAVRVRPFNHTGPGQDEAFVVPAFAAQVARIEAGRQAPTLRVGNLEAERDFLDVRDVVEAYRRIAAAPDGALAPGIVLNVASGIPRRIGDVLRALVAQARCPIRVEADPERLRPSDVPFAVGDAGRLREALGWTPSISWDRTLSDLLAACRAEVAG